SVVTLASSPDGTAWVQYEFQQPFRARAVTIASRSGIPVGRIAASDDTEHFQTLVELPGPQQYRGGLERTFAFPETVAKYYRLEISGAPLNPAATINQQRPQTAQQYVLSELVFHCGARVHRWEEKAGFSFLYQYESVPTPLVPASAAILHSQVIDLTLKMAADGTLEWDVPTGRWTIQRFGYSLTGAKNRPAPATGSGYEVDKLSRKHVESYFHGYIDPLATTLGPLFGKSLRYVTMDSWEAGMQNWTDEMLVEFRKRRGYDPTPYLPTLSGRVLDSGELSDRFLWDFRRTLADMFAENHYGTMAQLLHDRGIGLYAEAAGVSMEVIEDTLLNKSQVDIPMGEFWVRALHPELQYFVDVRGAASASHAYGKPLVATESFTGGNYESPFTLKKIADYWFAQGVNRLVFHTSAEQPLDTKPGNTMVGTHINRNITWAELAAPFMAYLSRNSFMLQQGLYVADVAYLLPEGAPSSQPFWGPGLHPACPDGYSYDCINTDVLLHRLSVGDDGRLMLPDGMSYRVLVLPEIDVMTPRVLRKIHELVVGGATVVGQKPVKSPSLEGYPQADVEVQSLAAELWGDLDGISRNRHFFGKGQIVWRLPLADVLASLPAPKDFESSRPLDADVVWIHRRSDNTDIYFVANHTDRSLDLQTRYRAGGKEAELWHPDTGAIEPAAYSIEEGRTTVPLHLAEREAVFVVFHRSTSETTRTLPQSITTELAVLNNPWEVQFPPGWGAPDKIELPKLESWTVNTNQGVKYFSGTATYRTSLKAPPSWFNSGSKLWLDLGAVKDLAEVSINGHALAALWKPPYKIDVSSELHAGENRVEIKVTNQWTNRIIGDRLVSPEQKVLSQVSPQGGSPGARGGFGGGSQLPPESGLLGPVTVVSQMATIGGADIGQDPK
ncbi:MAG TPA: glycosyl hydrolase, partial [Pirellulales bacterium]